MYFLISICTSLVLPSINLTEFVIYGAKFKVSAARIGNFMNIESKKQSTNSAELEIGEIHMKNYTASWIDPEQAKKLIKLDPTEIPSPEDLALLD